MPSPRDTPSPPPGLLVTGAFRKGPRYHVRRANGTRDWLLVFTLSGQGVFGHATGNIPAGPDDVILLKPGTPHDYGTAPGHAHWQMLWAHFIPRPGWIEWLDWPAGAPGILRLALHGHEQQVPVLRRFRAMLQLNLSPVRLREAMAMNALEEVVLRCDLANPRNETARLDERVRRALDYVGEHLAEPLKVDRLAAEVGLSPSRFAHLFRLQTGESPQRYLELQRLNRARQLLEFTQEPIQLVARQVGFENPFYFTLRFRRHCGASPRRWRQDCAKASPR